MKAYKITILILTVLLLTAGLASATVTFVKPNDATYKIEKPTKAEIPAQISSESRSKAPEPTSLATIGTWILGVIISFLRRTYAFAKRVFDVIVSVVALTILCPLILAVVLAIKLTSRGPVLYTQIRVGKSGKHFNIYKFRTMKVDAEKETGPVWARSNDNRLTAIGGLLRRSHIDEIPQFINVIKGEMSVIGPRPERPHFVNEFQKVIPSYGKRLMIKPGITGLAQVWHRYDETIEDVKTKVKYDILYMRKMSMWADLNIVFRTMRVMVTGEGAK